METSSVWAGPGSQVCPTAPARIGPAEDMGCHSPSQWASPWGWGWAEAGPGHGPEGGPSSADLVQYAGPDCGELEISPAVASLKQGLMAPGAKMMSWAVGRVWKGSSRAETVRLITALGSWTVFQIHENLNYILLFPAHSKQKQRSDSNLTSLALPLLMREWTCELLAQIQSNFLLVENSY